MLGQAQLYLCATLGLYYLIVDNFGMALSAKKKTEGGNDNVENDERWASNSDRTHIQANFYVNVCHQWKHMHLIAKAAFLQDLLNNPLKSTKQKIIFVLYFLQNIVFVFV